MIDLNFDALSLVMTECYGAEFEYECDRDEAFEAVRCMDAENRECAVHTKNATGGYITRTLSTGWAVGFDPSLSKDDVPVTKRVEINSPVFSRPWEINWCGLFGGLRRAGAIVTRRSGLHLHVDAAEFNNAVLVNICREANDSGVQVSKEREYYCKPVPACVTDLMNPSDEELRRAWFSGYKQGVPPYGRTRLHPARRRLVNLGSVWYRGTVEFRMFPSTLDATTLFHNLCIVSKIIDKARSTSGEHS